MAVTKVLNTKIALLYKSYQDWALEPNSNYIPAKGEVCICEVPQSTGTIADEPAVLFKVGDGIKTYRELPWTSALAADVYAWAKKENLDWADLSEDFMSELETYIAEKSPKREYQIVSDGDYKWKLQTRVGDGAWEDATGNIDITDLESRIATNEANIAKKVDRTIESTSGKAIIFNEADGGGAKFEHTDGSEAFIGVNNGGENGLMAQIYADKKNDQGKWEGAKLDVTNNGIYYTVGDKSFVERAIADNELATKGEVKALGRALHYIGMTELADGETVEHALDRVVVAYQVTHPSYVLSEGAVAIIKGTDSSVEYIYNGNTWDVFGDEGIYETKAHAKAEHDALTAAIGAEETRATSAEEALDAKIDAAVDAAETYIDAEVAKEKERAMDAESELDERLKYFEIAKEPEVQEIGGKTYLFANGVAIRIEKDNTNSQNIAYYCVDGNTQKSIVFPYDAIVHGGGFGTADKVADFNSTFVVMNDGQVTSVYGGSRNFGNVGVATVVINGGTLKDGVIGGGAAPSFGQKCATGLANITFNGGTSLTTYGGGMGFATVGKVDMLVNGGTHQWVTAGGSNGTTGSANIKVTGGNITCLQTVNRGTIQDATVTITGGTIARVYGGGETEDSSVDGKCEKTIFHIEGSFNGVLNKGTYGGVEDASRVSGDYIQGSVDAEQAANCNLILRTYPGLKLIAYTASTDDLEAGTEVWFFNSNF